MKRKEEASWKLHAMGTSCLYYIYVCRREIKSVTYFILCGPILMKPILTPQISNTLSSPSTWKPVTTTSQPFLHSVHTSKPENGADMLIQALQRHGGGITNVFAYSGGCSIDIHQALKHSNIRIIVPWHWQGKDSQEKPRHALPAFSIPLIVINLVGEWDELHFPIHLFLWIKVIRTRSGLACLEKSPSNCKRWMGFKN